MATANILSILGVRVDHKLNSSVTALSQLERPHTTSASARGEERYHPAHTIQQPNAGTMLGQRRRRWTKHWTSIGLMYCVRWVSAVVLFKGGEKTQILHAACGAPPTTRGLKSKMAASGGHFFKIQNG